MRTTLDIADDVLFAAREIAHREKKSLGQTISELARRAFTQPADANGVHSVHGPGGALLASERLVSYGISPLPARGGIVSNELIERLRDAEGI